MHGEEGPFGTHPLLLFSVLLEHDQGGFVGPVFYMLFGLQAEVSIEGEDKTRNEG